MIALLIVIHIIVCFILIAIVLLQSGKGAELGAAFGGGSSHTLFGSRGAATFLNKMTTVAAVVFMITSLTLAVVTAKGGSVVKKPSVVDEKKSIPTIPGPIQGGGVQPVQPSQQQVPQAQQQKAPQTQQQKPVKTQQQVTQKQQQKAPETQQPVSQPQAQPAPQTQQEVPQSPQQTPTK